MIVNHLKKYLLGTKNNMKTLKESLFDTNLSTKDVGDSVINPKEFIDSIEKSLIKFKSKYNLSSDELQFKIRFSDGAVHTTDDITDGHITIIFCHEYVAANGIYFKESIYMPFYATNKYEQDKPQIVMNPFRLHIECGENPYRNPSRSWQNINNFYSTKPFHLNVKKYHVSSKTPTQFYAHGSEPMLIDQTYKNKDIVIDYIESMIKGFFNRSQFDFIDDYFEKYAEEPIRANKITGSILTKVLKNIEK